MKIFKTLLLCLIVFFGCGDQNEKQAAAIRHDGTYTGILPCADCEGVNYQVTLNTDSTYNEIVVYIGKNLPPVESTGSWKMKDTNKIDLTMKDGVVQHLEISGSNLIMLDAYGNKIQGILADKFILKPGKMKDPEAAADKTRDSSAGSINGSWNLTELNDKKLDSIDFFRGFPFIDIREADNKFTGSTGCNRINGASTINGNYISFSKFVTTKMSCKGDGESKFIDALQTIDSYKISENKLMLISSGKTVLLFTR